MAARLHLGDRVVADGLGIARRRLEQFRHRLQRLDIGDQLFVGHRQPALHPARGMDAEGRPGQHAAPERELRFMRRLRIGDIGGRAAARAPGQAG